jgi:hypothetical protein
MLPLAERLASFSEALLDIEKPTPVGLVGPDGEPSPRRFSVYRNNVLVGLTEALRANFPVTERIVGDEFFIAMARLYAVVEPPTSAILLQYGKGFADFIAHFEPAASLPYLADVALIERATTEAYHSRDLVPLEPIAFADIPRDQTGSLRLRVHPSLRMVRSQFPALTIWQMNVGDGVPEPVDLTAGGEDALVVRPAAEVEVRSMPEGSFEFARALQRGKTLDAGLWAALEANANFDLLGNLRDLIGIGAFVELRMPGRTVRAH